MSKSKDYFDNKIMDAILHDKKMAGNEITVIYVPEIGTFEMKKMTVKNLADMVRKEEL